VAEGFLRERLRLETLLLWFLHVAETDYGVADFPYTECLIEYKRASTTTAAPVLERLRFLLEMSAQ
jgi:hypothetical protein